MRRSHRHLWCKSMACFMAMQADDASDATLATPAAARTLEVTVLPAHPT